MPGLGTRCVALCPAQEWTPRGYSWTGNTLPPLPRSPNPPICLRTPRLECTAPPGKPEAQRGIWIWRNRKKKRQESGHWENAAQCDSLSRNSLQKAIPGLGMRCVALFLIQELSPEGYAWTGNALRGAAPCLGIVGKLKTSPPKDQLASESQSGSLNRGRIRSSGSVRSCTAGSRRVKRVASRRGKRVA